MVKLENEAQKLMEARRAMEEARGLSRAAMIASMTQYEMVIQTMERDGVTTVQVGDTTIELAHAAGINFLNFVEKEQEHTRPEFGGVKGNHERRGQ